MSEAAEANPAFRDLAFRAGFLRVSDHREWRGLQHAAAETMAARERELVRDRLLVQAYERGFGSVEDYERWLCLEALRLAVLSARDFGDGSGQGLDGSGDLGEVEGKVPVGVRVDPERGLPRSRLGYLGKFYRSRVGHAERVRGGL